LTHRLIVADFYCLETTKKPSLPDGWIWMDEKMPAQLGKPRLVEHLLSLL
jgi:A/G-specific adenine glycosylase